MRYAGLKQWRIVLEQAARALQERSPSADPALFNLRSQPCSQHGVRCVVVIYGAIARHIDWENSPASDLAAQLLPGFARKPS